MNMTAAQVAARFAFPGPARDIEPYGQGHINDTYRLSAGDGGQRRRYILQRINHKVFADPRRLMDNVAAVTEHIRKAAGAGNVGAGFRELLTVIPTLDGESCLTTEAGETWRAYNFIEGGVSFQTVDTPELLAAAGTAYGRFARMLDDFPADSLHETIPHFHDTPKRFADLLRAVEADAIGRADGCREEIDFALRRRADCSVLVDLQNAGRLPLRVTHNDTKLNNVLIDPETMEGVCVIDLDTVMPGLIQNDFGDTIRTGATTAAEDEQDLSKVTFDLPLYHTYASHYLAEVADILTEDERRVLPWGARLMTLENGMRFLTDHLAGDVYYKTHRPGHNLDRARTQFKLVREMEAAWDEMQL